MKTIVTGASGRVGRLTLDALLARGVAAADLIAVTRDPDSRVLAPYRDLGVDARRGDNMDEPQSLDAAFAGGERLFIIPMTHPPREVDEAAIKRDVIDRAARAGVKYACFLSLVWAEISPYSLDDLEGERALQASGMAWTILRAAYFAESAGREFKQDLAAGRVVTNDGDQPHQVVTREDIAAAAAAALTDPEAHAGRIYNLVSDSFRTSEAVALLRQITGRPLELLQLDDAAFAEEFARMGRRGLPIEHRVWNGRIVREGAPVENHLPGLIGRPGRAFADLLRRNVFELTHGVPPDGQELQFGFLPQANP